MGELVRRRVWVSTYNGARRFGNGIVWVRVSVRVRRWRRLGGVWVSRRRPFVRLLAPQGPKGPIGG